MARSEAVKAAQARYEEKTKSYHFKCHIERDADIIAALEARDNKNGYIKELIREDMKKQG